jgi:hypothetical protein
VIKLIWQDLDAEIEPPSDASYLSGSPTTPPTRTVGQGDAFGQVGSPTTPSAVPTHQIEALSGLVRAMRHGRPDDSLEAIVRDTIMDLAEFDEEEDLDAEVEDMDDEQLESSIIEGDSMEL